MPSPYKLLLLESLARVGQDCEFPKFVFESLPFAVLRADAPTPNDPSVVAVLDHYPADQLRVLRCIDSCIANSVDVLNLSLGPVGKTFDANDPLQIATSMATQLGIPVIVAAGNKGPALDSLQPLARAPWVIAVGATDASDNLVDASSRGSVAGPKPTVVASGTIPRTDERFPEPLTSFAAPKVAAMVTVLQRFLQMVIADLSDKYQDRWSYLSNPIAVSLTGVVDTGVNVDELPPWNECGSWLLSTGYEHLRPARSDLEARWYGELMGCLDVYSSIEINSSPETIKRCLRLAATAMPDLAEHHVGAGLVSERHIIDFMSGFTPSRFVEVFCPQVRDQVPGGMLEKLDASLGPVWPRQKCEGLAYIVVSTSRLFVCKCM